MIELELENMKDFKAIISVAEKILKEIKIEADHDGIRFRGLDGGHTSYFEVDFKKDYFTNYQLDEIDNIIIDTSELNKVLKRVKNDDDTTIIINKESMIIKVLHDNNNKTFEIHSIDMEYSSPSMPSMEFPVNTDVVFQEFKENVEDAALYEDKLYLQVEKDELIISNEALIGKYDSRIKLENTFDKKYRSIFKIDLIDQLFKLTHINSIITLNMGDDMPLLMKLTDTFEEINIKLLIAPRIEE